MDGALMKVLKRTSDAHEQALQQYLLALHRLVRCYVHDRLERARQIDIKKLSFHDSFQVRAKVCKFTIHFSK